MFYRIEVPAYFSTRINMQREASTFHVNGTAAMEKHVTVIKAQGGAPAAVELTAAQYRAECLAKLVR